MDKVLNVGSFSITSVTNNGVVFLSVTQYNGNVADNTIMVPLVGNETTQLIDMLMEANRER